MSGPLKKYRYKNDAGHETVLKLNAADAERYGLTDGDAVDAAPAVEEKAVPAAPNKARAASANKGRAPRGKGGPGGGD
ncbi:hypothetical protein ACFQ6Q_00805 [Streptomyces sp. NPDC056437]|uniref:hypothetical protein n=1 Tax=Streptomyces sp. NPDC056437 TaxID=3345816 RepID=UPI0036A4DA4D